MDPALFLKTEIGLRDRLFDIRIEDRITYSARTNTLFMDFSGMRVNTVEEIERIKEAVEATLKPLGRRVVAIVNYESFWVNPDISDLYLDLVRHVETNYYLRVSRYTTSGFMRIKLSRGLEERHVTSSMVKDYVAATDSLQDRS